MNRKERIQLLRLACAGDRLELALATRPAPTTLVARVMNHTELGPVLRIAQSFVGPFLPRKLRLLLVAVRAWSRMRER